MNGSTERSTPQSEAELLLKCQALAGLNLAQLASLLNIKLPENPKTHKGWVGLAIELALGATSSTKSRPDFHHLGIELKTLPLNSRGLPAESTFITKVPQLSIHQQLWTSSNCYLKTKRILWLPFEGDTKIPFPWRRIGHGFLWSPTLNDMEILEDDWSLLAMMIASGRLAEINASIGEYLQIRPKAANGKSLCYGFDSTGNKVLTIPRGFYLRASFTKTLFN